VHLIEIRQRPALSDSPSEFGSYSDFDFDFGFAPAVDCGSDPLARQTRIASHCIGGLAKIAHRTWPTSCKQVVAKIASNINFRTFSGCVRRAHATRNQPAGQKKKQAELKRGKSYMASHFCCLLAANLLR